MGSSSYDEGVGLWTAVIRTRRTPRARAAAIDGGGSADECGGDRRTGQEDHHCLMRYQRHGDKLWWAYRMTHLLTMMRWEAGTGLASPPSK